MRSIAWFACSLLSACGGGHSASNSNAASAELAAKISALAASATPLQNREPIDALNVYMDGFHFISGSMQGQMEAHHYCTAVNDDLNQCVIFDSNGHDAKVIGVEYIVSQSQFARLPDEEKKLWHSHVYEIKSGQLIAPGISQAAELALMEKFIGTYGKTWNTWQSDRQDDLPIGQPLLMMGFTGDGQARPEMLSSRDGRFNVNRAEKAKSRSDLLPPSIDPTADSWQKEPARQVFIGPANAR